MNANRLLEGHTKDNWNGLEIIKEERFITLTEGVKTVVAIEYGHDKKREVTIEKDSDKIVISIGGATEADCEMYKKECDSGNKILCTKYDTNCKEKDEVKVETKEEVEIKDDKIYINKKEIKIMPDTASEKAIEILQTKKEITLELKDTGKPIYEVEGEKDGKMFGIFKIEMKVKVEIDAETGEVISAKKPWWAFLVKE